MTTETYTPHPITATITLIEFPTTLAGKYQLSFHLNESQTVSLHLTQGELLGLWQEVGAYFNLAGMGDAKRAAGR
jgi:hypothetical protein